MNINTGDGSPTAAAEASQEGSTPSENQTQPQATDHLKNLKGEFNRKLSKMEQKLDAVLNAFNTKSSVSQEPADEAAEVDTDVKQYVNSVVTQQHQKSALDEAYKLFPELDPESDDFDEKFYKAVDAEFTSNQRKDPKGPLKAAKLIALELGKYEALTRANVIKDEARRSRILSEGSSTPRESKKSQEPSAQFNVKGLARLGINPDKLAKRMKDNKDKYEGL